MRGAVAVALLAALVAGPATALETDQFYAWTRPLEDATDVLNAKVNLEIQRALDRINARNPDAGCGAVARRISSRFRFFIFHEIEMWIANTELVDRIPKGAEEERDFRQRYLFRHLGRHEMANWVPPSPTIEIAGIRIGTDKLAHFFSEGFLYYRAVEKFRNQGASLVDARNQVVDLGIHTERSVLGQASSGVFSGGDLEANYQGMLFLEGLCEGDAPTLEHTSGGWRIARAFDWRNHITPEWDESWQPFVLSPRRWKKIRPALISYCDELDHPAVRARRRAYAERDTVTHTERKVAIRVAAGKMPDPAGFSIERICAQSESASRTGSPTASGPPSTMRP